LVKSLYVGVALELNLRPIIEAGSSNCPIIEPEAGRTNNV
jgi:hypothetical protein